MPPKAKFTREQIRGAALELVRERGAGALTARALAEKLGSSPRPIFTVYSGMEQVLDDVRAEARKIYRDRLRGAATFRDTALRYILFAMDEPKLFSLLFMTERENAQVCTMFDDGYGKALMSIQKRYGVTERTAMKLCYHVWVYCHGAAALCVAKQSRISPREAAVMLDEMCGCLTDRLRPGDGSPSEE